MARPLRGLHFDGASLAGALFVDGPAPAALGIALVTATVGDARVTAELAVTPARRSRRAAVLPTSPTQRTLGERAARATR